MKVTISTPNPVDITPVQNLLKVVSVAVKSAHSFFFFVTLLETSLPWLVIVLSTLSFESFRDEWPRGPALFS